MPKLKKTKMDPKDYAIYMYKAWVVRVVDGDTVYLDLDLGFNLYRNNLSYRLLGIDTPEIRGKERPEGLVAKARVEELLPKGKEVRVRTWEAGKYGRYIAEIYIPEDKRSISQILLDEGLAEVYE